MSLRDRFNEIIQQGNEHLPYLTERGLIREDAKLDNEVIRQSVVEQALMRFAMRSREEQADVIAKLGIVEAAILEGPSTTRQFADIRQHQPTIFASLESRARKIWSEATEHIRERARELDERIDAATQRAASRDYKAALEELRTASRGMTELDASLNNAMHIAKVNLRREFTAEYGRKWEPDVRSYFDNLTSRSVFQIPKEQRDASTHLASEQQRLAQEMRFTTEAARRLENRPEPTPGMSPSMSPGKGR